MVPIPDDPVTPNPTCDPVRFLIHAALALYLSPVILVVCLVGSSSILAGKAAKFTRRVVRKINRRGDGRRPVVVKTEVGELNALRASDRKRSPIAR
jgi:hypothetical protein